MLRLQRTMTHVITKTIFLCFCCINLISQCDALINRTKVYLHYITACGADSFCDVDNLPGPLRTNPRLGFLPYSLCPKCYCDNLCAAFGDCCLDKLLDYPKMTCISTSLTEPDTPNNTSFAFVDDCKNGGIQYDKSLHPVTSLKTGLPYKNIQHAKCNENGTDDEFMKWDLALNCYDYKPFHFLSDLQKAIQVARNLSCQIYFVPYNLTESIPTFPEYAAKGKFRKFRCSSLTVDFSKSTLYGKFVMSDPEIQWACKQINQPIGMISNIFCLQYFLPNFQKYNSIQKCNETGHWDIYDPSLEQSCHDYPSSNITKPYKNIFCYACNKKSFHALGKLFDASGIMTEVFSDGRFIFSLEIFGYETEAFFLYFDEIENDIEDDTRKMEEDDNKLVINNFNRIVQQIIAECNIAEVIGIFQEDTCSVDNCNNLHTVSPIDPCCAIVKVVERYSCIPTDGFFGQKSSNISGYQVITSCMFKDSKYAFYCKHYNDITSVYSLPCFMKGKHYKNIFCAVCNSDKPPRYSVARCQPWMIKINCKGYLPHLFHTTSNDILHEARTQNCTINTSPERHEIPCYIGDYKGKVNTKLHGNSSDNEFFCEKLRKSRISSYKQHENVFCALSQDESPDCHYLVTNLHSSYQGSSFGSDEYIQTDKVQSGTIRNLFMLTWHNNIDIQHKRKGDYETTYCYPGRVFNGERCLPVFPITKKLRYILMFNIQFHGSTILHLPTIKDLMQKLFENRVGNYFYWHQVFLKSSQPCEAIVDDPSVYMNAVIYFPYFFTREHVEQDLLTFMSLSYSVGDTHLITVTQNKNPQTINVPMMLQSPLQSGCRYYDSKMVFDSANDAAPLLVSKLLICPLMKLSENYVEKSLSGYEFRINGKRVIYDEYLPDLNGNVYVCKDDFQNVILTEVSYSMYLQTLSVVFTCVSLTCTSFTFIHFCILQRQRTLPIFNSMAHLVSLFLSQTLLQFGLLDISYMPLCLAYGIILHYSWLCTFFTLNICCFHIFRIFSDISFAKVVSTRRHRQQIIYLLYSFGVPLILVCINVIYNLQRNNDLGYKYPSCFISNWLSNIVTFTAPVGLITIVDLVLFVFTTRYLNSTKHSRAMALSSDNHTVNREHFKVYIKTFFLSGATWILSLVDMFMPITILTYVTVILNSSQGVFLFVIYICNKNVLTSYRKRLTDVFQRSTSSSDPRTMSTSDK